MKCPHCGGRLTAIGEMRRVDGKAEAEWYRCRDCRRLAYRERAMVVS